MGAVGALAMNIIKTPSAAYFFICFIAYLAIRGRYASQTKRLENVHRQVDRLETALLLLVIPTSLILPLLYLFTPLLNFANYELPTAARWCGAVLMPVSLWLFWRSHADLGLNWSASLEVRKGHQLVTSGVYRRIRHPMYAAILLVGAAQALLLPNWLAGFSALVPFIILCIIRTP